MLKRITTVIILVLSLLVLISAPVSAGITPPPWENGFIYGDVNMSGVTDMGDVTAIEFYIVGIWQNPPNYVMTVGDLNQNGYFDMGDTVLIERLILGIDNVPDWWINR